ncbi:unnamed protein product [Fusarium venenatum]|uniref:Uncharacterized protein n=1 Tax=Fusarium venenatum TaxID=56646 RepID=A0A2L2TGL3_9HYPO|nr:uncharacterized protein FVRRES_12148 [Fusarium venenatum]CEI39457.1 unnamed protein product [Fusarium venenatum]
MVIGSDWSLIKEFLYRSAIERVCYFGDSQVGRGSMPCGVVPVKEKGTSRCG